MAFIQNSMQIHVELLQKQHQFSTFRKTVQVLVIAQTCARVVCAHTDLINQSEPSSCQGPIRLKNVTLINSNDLSCQYFWGFFLLSVFFSFYKSCKKKKLRKRHFNQFYIDSDFQKQPSIKAAREAGFRRI